MCKFPRDLSYTTVYLEESRNNSNGQNVSIYEIKMLEPIAFLPVFSIVLENILRCDITNYVESNKLLGYAMSLISPWVSTYVILLLKSLDFRHSKTKDFLIAEISWCSMSKVFNSARHSAIIN